MNSYYFDECWTCDECGNSFALDFDPMFELGNKDIGYHAVCEECKKRIEEETRVA